MAVSPHPNLMLFDDEPAASPASTNISVKSRSDLSFFKPSSPSKMDERKALYFFVSCQGVDGTSLVSHARSAQTLVRDAFNILSSAKTMNSAKSPRAKPPTEINVEVRVSQETPLFNSTPDFLVQATDARGSSGGIRNEMASSVDLSADKVELSDDKLLDQESFWSERRKSRNPLFSVGFSIRCKYGGKGYDRHVQIMVMVPDEGTSSNKNSHVFGYASTSFQEMYAVATSGNYTQRMTLPVHSTVVDGATVELQFANIQPQQHPLFTTRNELLRSFLFYPYDRKDLVEGPLENAKLAVEEAAEVDFSVSIPLQLLRVCQCELLQMYDEWKLRYNYSRKKNGYFDNDAEALSFGHDVYRVQVVCGRDLKTKLRFNPSVSAANVENEMTTELSSRSSNSGFSKSISGGRGRFVNRIKAGKWGGSGSPSFTSIDSGTAEAGEAITHIHSFVVVKYAESIDGNVEYIVGKTNTEYDTPNPVWSTNKYASTKCSHGKPSTRFHASKTLKSRVVVSPVNALNQFVFYRKSVPNQPLAGSLRFEVFHEHYGYMSGIENDFIGEVVIPLQSVSDTMVVEEKVVYDDDDGTENIESCNRDVKPHQIVTSLTLVNWFDVVSPSTHDKFGQIQLRINILLANPVLDSWSDDHQAHDPSPVLRRRYRQVADCSPPPNDNVIENSIPLSFLYPHVLNIRKQITAVTDMIRFTEQLVEEKSTFKSSLLKKCAAIQGIPTNLHVSYFRIFRNFGSQFAAQPQMNVEVATEDLLGLEDEGVQDVARDLPSVQQRMMKPETYASVTCGAPTAHAMGLSDCGLREMELEMHNFQSMLEKSIPHVLECLDSDSHNLISEDSLNVYYPPIEEEIEVEVDDDVDSSGLFDTAATNDSICGIFSDTPATNDATCSISSDAHITNNSVNGLASDTCAKNEPARRNSSDKPASSHSNRPAAVSSTPFEQVLKKKSSKYSIMARKAAVARAKALSSNRFAKKKKTARQLHQKNSNDKAAVDVKYPPLRIEPAESVDSATSMHYAVQLLCRLEMLRAEYYLRKSVAVSQSVSSLVTCFLAELDLCLQERKDKVLDQMAKVGFLIGWESLISSHGKELVMISDAWVAIKCLETFSFQLCEGSDMDVVVEKQEGVGYIIKVPVSSSQFSMLPESLRSGGLIHVTAVLFTQGINEMQSLANIVGHSGVSIQRKINSTSFCAISEYYNRLTTVCRAEINGSSYREEILHNLRVSVESENSASKNTCILLHAADAVRSLNGGRVTYCKSGKDRTAMSMTLEQARLLVEQKRNVLQELESGNGKEDGPLDEVKNVANMMREFGVRIQIAKKNVGRFKYSFNSLQRKLLPEIYRPPMSTIQDMVTSVKARDS
ncbi:hypothetical protein PsorP6_014451 [Peronosclerospora sorghi]|uniref:Uncharacterized protein n=1 Tax=Peronosclerospora sorghi TaxID=230839 RepID=A0ACC0VV28_9STRA|nr:hypothetical protein PsorP6_014451 [Peronosclerospora sorghi]